MDDNNKTRGRPRGNSTGMAMAEASDAIQSPSKPGRHNLAAEINSMCQAPSAARAQSVHAKSPPSTNATRKGARGASPMMAGETSESDGVATRSHARRTRKAWRKKALNGTSARSGKKVARKSGDASLVMDCGGCSLDEARVSSHGGTPPIDQDQDELSLEAGPLVGWDA